jgi:prefoldin subunit 5
MYTTLEELDARLKYLQSELEIMNGLHCTMNNTDRSEIDHCEREIAELLEERAELVQHTTHTRRRKNPD